jgi:Fe-S cluster biogenesis protein NfuA
MPDDAEMQSPPPSVEEVEAFLDRVRPGLIADRGNLELVGIDSDGTVRVVFQGACVRCPAQFATLRVAIEEPLRRAHPGTTAVIAL